jgi:hypothetical protein
MMLETLTQEHQILSDGRQVWVNSAQGMCIGRFSAGGVDIHLDYEEQLAQGKECLECFVRTPDAQSDWQRFVVGMQHHYGVQVDEEHRPNR